MPSFKSILPCVSGNGFVIRPARGPTRCRSFQ